MSRGQSEEGKRRRRTLDEEAVDPRSEMSESATSASAVDRFGQAMVREALSGSGLGPLSPILAAELALEAGGLEPGVLALDSNEQMQAVLAARGASGGDAWLTQVMGELPDAVRAAVDRGLGLQKQPGPSLTTGRILEVHTSLESREVSERSAQRERGQEVPARRAGPTSTSERSAADVPGQILGALQARALAPPPLSSADAPPRRQALARPEVAAPPRSQRPLPSGPAPIGPVAGPGSAAPLPVPPAPSGAATQEEHAFELQLDVELPAELRGAGVEPPAHVCPAPPALVQVDVGASMVPSVDHRISEAQPLGNPGSPTGDALTSTGVRADVAATPVSVTPSAQLEPGQGAAVGGAPAAVVPLADLNPAVAKVLPDAVAHEAATPASTPAVAEPAAVRGQRGGGGGELPEAQVEGVRYAAREEHLPEPAAPTIGGDFAAGPAEAQAQLATDAAELAAVQDTHRGQVTEQVAPLGTEGARQVGDSSQPFFERMPLLPQQAGEVTAAAHTTRDAAQATAAAALAAAAARQEAALSDQAALPVPAELARSAETVAQASTEAHGHAGAVWEAGPEVQLPSGAQAALQQAAADVARVQAAAEQPDLHGTVGAVRLPEHGLQPPPFGDVVPADQQRLDPSVLPQAPTQLPDQAPAEGALGEIRDQVNAELEPEVLAYQQQILDEQTARAIEGYDGILGDSEACYQGAVDEAGQAIADYDAADVSAVVTPFADQAADAFASAQGAVEGAISGLHVGLDGHRGAFETSSDEAQATLHAAVGSAQDVHLAALQGAGQAYEDAVGSARAELQQGHDEALGTYANQADAAREGAAQTVRSERQLADDALSGHQAELDGQLRGHLDSALFVDGQAAEWFTADHEAYTVQLEEQTQAVIGDSQAEIQREITVGQAELHQTMRQGQADAQAELDVGEQHAQRERDQAQGEADAKHEEAKKKKKGGFLRKIGNWFKKAFETAVKWIKGRFEAAKKAIVGFLESAREAALRVLRAVRDVALAVLDEVRGFVQSVIDAVADTLRALVSAVADLVTELIGAIVDWVVAQIERITALVDGLLQAFQSLVHLVVEGLVAAVALVDADLAEQLGSAADRFLQRFDQVVDGAQAAIQQASATLQQQIRSAGDALQAAVRTAEDALVSAIDAAESALHAGVDAVYQVAVDAVEAAYQAAEAAVNMLVDLARDAVIALIHAVYSAIETVALGLARAAQAVFDALATAVEWVDDKIVGPLLAFLADPWTGLRKMWVAFWNSPWRDVLLGVALTALATGLAIATGGLGLVAMVAITAAVTGATAGAVYGAGELGARRANVSLTKEGHQTWKGGTLVDPVTGEPIPDPRDPRNAWYLDTLGSISSNPDGSMSYVDAAGERVTLTAEQLARDPAALDQLLTEGLRRGEDGSLRGESLSDSLRGAGAIAADKAIEWTANGAVTALTLGLGSQLTAAQQAGKVGRAVAQTTRITGSAALASTSDTISAPVSDAVSESISDGRSFTEAFDMAWQHDSVGDFATAWGTSFAANAAGDVVGDSLGTTTYARVFGKTDNPVRSTVGRTGTDALAGAGSAGSEVLVGNASDVVFDGDPQTGWRTFWERSTSREALDQVIYGTVQSSLSSRTDEFAENYGQTWRTPIEQRWGSRGVASLELAVMNNAHLARGADETLLGHASPVHADSRFRGDQVPGGTIGEQQILAPAVRSVVRPLGLSVDGRPPGVDLGGGQRVTFRVADPAHEPAGFLTEVGVNAAFYLPRSGGEGYDVYVSSQLHPDDVARAVAHELAEIRFVESRRASGSSSPRSEVESGALVRGLDPTEVLTGHDVGRVAEAAFLIDQLQAGVGERDVLQRELDLLLDETGLQNDDGAPQRLALLHAHEAQIGSGVVDVVTRHLDRKRPAEEPPPRRSRRARRKRYHDDLSDEVNQAIDADQKSVALPDLGSWSADLDVGPDGRIADVYVAERPATAHGADQGSHLTAWVALADVVRTTLRGKDVSQAASAAQSLLVSVGQVDPVAPDWASVRSAVSQYLELRNRQPLASTDGTANRDGAGEPRARAILLTPGLTREQFALQATQLFDATAAHKILDGSAHEGSTLGTLVGSHLADVYLAYGLATRAAADPFHTAALGLTAQLMLDDLQRLVSVDEVRASAQATLRERTGVALTLGPLRGPASISPSELLKRLKAPADLGAFVSEVAALQPVERARVADLVRVALGSLTPIRIQALKDQRREVKALEKALTLPGVLDGHEGFEPSPVRRLQGPVGTYVRRLAPHGDVEVFGRPDGLHGEGMGRHTTAWVVYQDRLSAGLRGKSDAQAVAWLSARWDEARPTGVASGRQAMLAQRWRALGTAPAVEARAALLLARWNVQEQASFFTGRGDAPGDREGDTRHKIHRATDPTQRVQLVADLLDPKAALASALSTWSPPPSAEALAWLAADARLHTPSSLAGVRLRAVVHRHVAFVGEAYFDGLTTAQRKAIERNVFVAIDVWIRRSGGA